MMFIVNQDGQNLQFNQGISLKWMISNGESLCPSMFLAFLDYIYKTNMCSRRSRCILCPEIEGCMKQTTSAKWIQVICTIWTNELNFGNRQYLEFIEGVGGIETDKIHRQTNEVCLYSMFNQKFFYCVSCKLYKKISVAYDTG